MTYMHDKGLLGMVHIADTSFKTVRPSNFDGKIFLQKRTKKRYFRTIFPLVLVFRLTEKVPPNHS